MRACSIKMAARMTEMAPQPDRERSLPWAAIGFGLAVVVVLVVVLLLMSQQSGSGRGSDSYAANLNFSDTHVSAAQNLVGATVIYVDGSVSNTGKQDVTHLV